MTKTAWSLLFCLVLVLSAPCPGGQDCFLVVAGRNATADGSVIMGHNEDNGIEMVFGMRRVERMVHNRGEFVELAGGIRMAQVDTTYGYLVFEMPGKPFSHSLLNEHGVAVVSNSCPSREDRPDLRGGIGIGPVLDFPDLPERSIFVQQCVRPFVARRRIPAEYDQKSIPKTQRSVGAVVILGQQSVHAKREPTDCGGC